MKIEARRELETMPYAKTFFVANGNEEQCNATGDEVLIDGEWWNEYADAEGNLYYGR